MRYVPTWLRLTAALTLMCATTACAHLTQTAVTADAICDAWEVQTWSVRDTDETILGVKRNNERRAAVCG